MTKANEQKMSDQQIEALLLKNQRELQETQTRLIKLKTQRALNKKKIKVTDILSVPEDLRYSFDAVYSVYTKATGETTFFNGPQAANNEKYTDLYIIVFDHIMLSEDQIVGNLADNEVIEDVEIDEDSTEDIAEDSTPYDEMKRPQLDAELNLRGLEFNPMASNKEKVALLVADDNK